MSSSAQKCISSREWPPLHFHVQLFADIHMRKSLILLEMSSFSNCSSTYPGHEMCVCVSDFFFFFSFLRTGIEIKTGIKEKDKRVILERKHFSLFWYVSYFCSITALISCDKVKLKNQVFGWNT